MRSNVVWRIVIWRDVIRHNVVWPTVGVLSDSASYAESLRCVYSCLGLGSANPC